MLDVIQHSLWGPERVQQQEEKQYTWGDEIESLTRYVGGDDYNTLERLQKLATIIACGKYQSIEMRDAAGKPVAALVTVKGARVEGNSVLYWGTLTEPCTIYGGKSRYGNNNKSDESADEDLNDYE